MTNPPCTCEACTLANVTRPPVTIPAFRDTPARELHGVELRDYYAGQDELRATINKLRGIER